MSTLTERLDNHLRNVSYVTGFASISVESSPLYMLCYGIGRNALELRRLELNKYIPVYSSGVSHYSSSILVSGTGITAKP